jgi:phosphopantothenoylcysteine decarboxylase/phosphopantothenate--cysteine ligase
MDLDMYQHPTTQVNLQKLQSYGNLLLPPGNGPLASGLSGEGRMAEPEAIQQAILDYFEIRLPLHGKNVLVTAGPTYEAIDPVRFIGNRSTGKMGYALAGALAAAGASVTLVSGPVSLALPPGNIRKISVESAAEMYEAAMKHFESCNWAVFTAAVADYRPSSPAKQKIKKSDAALAIELTPTHDILAAAGNKKREGQLVIGFALETENELSNAIEKLQRKKADLLVLNSLQDAGAGFGHDTNKVTLVSAREIRPLPLASKQEIATSIVEYLQTL